MTNHNIPSKANKVFNIVILCLLLTAIRAWYLAVIQHDHHRAMALKPQRRTVIDPIARGTIVDRFGIPLATNKMQYNAAVCYAHIREIPAISWQKDKHGKTVRVQTRALYITQLSQLIAKELGLDAVFIEDLIHGKASMFPHTPFVLKEAISEKEYYRLKMLEKDWIGIYAQQTAKRFYPQGKVGCDIVGYVGAIGAKKYQAIADEMHELEGYIQARERHEYPFLPTGYASPLAVRDRLHELREKSYTINDLVGKEGLEAAYEETLRGTHGKKMYEIDFKGNILRELAGTRPAVSGSKVALTVSVELQKYAESLLAAHESSNRDDAAQTLDERWMRGGAIVAMLPKTGEIISLASYPRFYPNDFIPSKDVDNEYYRLKSVRKWLESEAYIGEIWDGKRLLERESFSFTKNRYETHAVALTWPVYLKTILPSEGPLSAIFAAIPNIETALAVQELGTMHPFLKAITHMTDRHLVIDLCHIAFPRERCSTTIASLMGKQPLHDYFALRQTAIRLKEKLKDEIRELYHDIDFTQWREKNFKELLRKKRKEERALKQYAKPYTEYLDRAEKRLFQAFWEAYQSIFLFAAVSGNIPIALESYPHLRPYFAQILQSRDQWLANDTTLSHLAETIHKMPSTTIAMEYLHTFRGFEDLTQPLHSLYSRIRKQDGVQLEKHLAAAFYPLSKYGYGRSQAFRQIAALGSVFKLVTAYSTLWQRVQERSAGATLDLNPLVIIDDLKGSKQSTSPTQILGYTLGGQPIHRLYKGGLLPRSSYSNMGKLDLIGALEQSSNVYFSLLASDILKDPMDLARSAKLFGFGAKTGIDLPGEEPGYVPDDLASNRNGLYAMAIGQHSLVVTPLQTAIMMATIANQGNVVKPHIVQAITSQTRSRQYDSLVQREHFPFQKALSGIGIYFPLFSATLQDAKQQSTELTAIQLLNTIPFPREISSFLVQGMHKAVSGSRGTARPTIMSNGINHPSALQDYFELSPDLIAKTGTAQVLYKQSVDVGTKAIMRTHVWYTCISYPRHTRLQANRYETPELVVVVFLRFSRAGREGGTIAGQIIKKWREIQARNTSQSTPP